MSFSKSDLRLLLQNRKLLTVTFQYWFELFVQAQPESDQGRQFLDECLKEAFTSRHWFKLAECNRLSIDLRSRCLEKAVSSCRSYQELEVIVDELFAGACYSAETLAEFQELFRSSVIIKRLAHGLDTYGEGRMGTNKANRIWIKALGLTTEEDEPNLPQSAKPLSRRYPQYLPKEMVF